MSSNHQRLDTLQSEPDQHYFISPCPDPAVCSLCGVVYEQGHFHWGAAPADADGIQCPACQRIQAEAVGGRLVLSGDYYLAHQTSILDLVQVIEAAAKDSHPLERIISILKLDDRAEITTTFAPLARRIAQTLETAYQGDLCLQLITDEGPEAAGGPAAPGPQGTDQAAEGLTCAAEDCQSF